MLYGGPKPYEELLKTKGMTAASAFYPAFRGGLVGFGQGPSTLPSKDFRHRFIIAKDNLKVNSLDKNGRRTGPTAKNPKNSTTCLNLRQIKSG